MLELIDVTYAYPGAASPAVEGVSLRLAPGERVALVGSNGSGKSTVAQLAHGAAIADSGVVTVDGLRVGEADPVAVARRVGVVRQDPASQLVYSTVRDEVAFGPRCLLLPVSEVRARTSEALRVCGLAELAEREVDALSDGQRQLLALAGVLALRPAYLVLDEACAHLDPPSRQAIAALVDRLVQEGVGVLQITHDAREVVGASRVVELAGGVVAWEGEADAWIERVADDCLAVSAPARDALDLPGRPTTDDRPIAPDLAAAVPAAPARSAEREADLSFSGVTVAYDGVLALRDASLVAPGGALTLVVGNCGSGKTTLARAAAGLVAPTAGAVRLGDSAVSPGDVGLVCARAIDQLFAATVADDVAFAPLNAGLDAAGAASAASEALALAGVSSSVAAASPFAISGGEQRRAALAGVVAARPRAYVLDEPTAGLDVQGRAVVRRLVGRLVAEGCAVVVVTHDVDLWLMDAARVVELADGCVSFSGVVADYRAHAARMDSSSETSEVSSGAGGRSGAPSGVAPGELVGVPARPLARLVASLPAGAKVAALLLLTVALFAVDSAPVVGVGAGVVLGLLVAVAGVGDALRTLGVSLIVMAFVLSGSAVTVVGGGDVPIVGPVALSLAGLRDGCVAAARIAALVCATSVLARTTTASAIAEAVTSPARLVPRLSSAALVVQVAITTIPQVRAAFSTSSDAMRVRGAPLDSGPLAARVRAYAAVLVPTIVSSFMRANDRAAAMVARCYTGEMTSLRS